MSFQDLSEYTQKSPDEIAYERKVNKRERDDKIIMIVSTIITGGVMMILLYVIAKILNNFL